MTHSDRDGSEGYRDVRRQFVDRIIERAHTGGNGEDCPICQHENLPYPFLCRGFAAPAGLPLHESADRDADNVPSVEEPWREYAEAMCRVAHFDGWIPPVAIPGNRDPKYRVAACFQCQKAARACVAVEDQRIARVEDRIAAYADNPDEEWAGRLIAQDFADALRPEPTDAP